MSNLFSEIVAITGSPLKASRTIKVEEGRFAGTSLKTDCYEGETEQEIADAIRNTEDLRIATPKVKLGVATTKVGGKFTGEQGADFLSHTDVWDLCEYDEETKELDRRKGKKRQPKNRGENVNPNVNPSLNADANNGTAATK